MTRLGMVVNAKACVDCHACRTACQNQNDLPAEVSFVTFHDKETGTFPTIGTETVPTQCMQCEDAPCAAVCPTRATYVDDRGVVRVDKGRCIGCRYCIAACPYGARTIDQITGIVDKCRLCVADSKEEDHATNCVNACPAHVRIFGDLDDPSSEVAKAVVSMNAQPISKNLSHAKFYFVR